MCRAVLVGLVLTMLLSNCTKDHTQLSNCQYQDCPIVSFNAKVIPIFTQYCDMQGCHIAASHEGGVTLDSARAYFQVTAPGTGYVTPGNPLNSIIYNQFGQHIMPPTGYPAPSDCEVQEIYCWIHQGAQNN